MSSVDEVIGPMQGRVMGVIIPPPEIRAVADKTAQFVAKNGKSFEQKILNSAEGKTPKFNFMRMTDPYYAYYEMKIREFEEGTAQPKPPSATSVQTQSQQPPSQQQQTIQAIPEDKARVPTSTIASKASFQNPLSKFVLNKTAGEPPQFQFAIAHPPGLSAMDVDIIKLTAQYTALNGRDFLSGLAQREARNPQFDFLKPTHMLFSYFTTLVDSYAKLLQPTQDIVSRAKRNADELAALEAAVQRWEWQRQEEEKRRRDAAEADAERNALAGVDWQDFTVVETIDFAEDELLDLVEFSSMNPFAPLPSSSSSGASGGSAPPPPPPPSGMQPMEITPEDIDADINVVSDYQPRLAPGGKKVATMIDPISGKAVPVADLSEHMRIQLMDPKWRIEQQRFLSKQAETSYAEGSSIADSLKQFARQRGDIFGTEVSEDEEAKKRQKKSEEPEPIMWDGHQASIAMVQQAKAEQAAKMPAPEPSYAPPAIGPSPMPPPPIPMLAPPAPPMPVPPIAPHHHPMMSYGMPAPMMPSMPMYPGMPAPLPPPSAPMMGMHAPMAPPMMTMPQVAPQPAATPAPTSTTLVSEEEFAARFPNPVSITVFLPPSDTGAGSSVHLSISVTSQIKDVKDMLVDPSGLAPNKQQIKFQGAFVKDAQTLASLNIGEGAQLELLGRSRGGKR
jgi:splicing factor 3A subunit 1